MATTWTVLFVVALLSWPCIFMWWYWGWSKIAAKTSKDMKLTEKLDGRLLKKQLRKGTVVLCIGAVVWMFAISWLGHLTIQASIKLQATSHVEQTRSEIALQLKTVFNEIAKADWKKHGDDDTEEIAKSRIENIKKRFTSLNALLGANVTEIEVIEAFGLSQVSDDRKSTIDSELTALGNSPFAEPTGSLKKLSPSDVSVEELNRLILIATFTDINGGKNIAYEAAKHRLQCAEWYFSDELHWSSIWAVVIGYQAPLRDSLASRLLQLPLKQSKEEDTRNAVKISRTIQVLLDGSSLKCILRRNDLSEDSGKAFLDAVAMHLEPKGWWLLIVSTLMSILLGIFQIFSMIAFVVGVSHMIQQRNEIALQRQLIPLERIAVIPDGGVFAKLENADDAKGNEMLEQYSYHDFLSFMPAFADSFWNGKAAERFAARIQVTSNENGDFLIPRVFSDFFGRLRNRSGKQLTSGELAEFLESSRDALDRKASDYEKKIDIQAQSYIAISETIGFLGTLLGIIIAFGAIPAMQLPTNDALNRASTMSTVTSGLVLAFATTLVAQSAKLVLIMMHRSRRRELADLCSTFIGFVERFIEVRRA